MEARYFCKDLSVLIVRFLIYMPIEAIKKEATRRTKARNSKQRNSTKQQPQNAEKGAEVTATEAKDKKQKITSINRTKKQEATKTKETKCNKSRLPKS